MMLKYKFNYVRNNINTDSQEYPSLQKQKNPAQKQDL
ncbi:MAG: hypothetical protein K0R36_752 [Chryseobacterium sp.]|nr:hypothetical protein [Chryseobacterium sp.]